MVAGICKSLHEFGPSQIMVKLVIVVFWDTSDVVNLRYEHEYEWQLIETLLALIFDGKIIWDDWDFDIGVLDDDEKLMKHLLWWMVGHKIVVLIHPSQITDNELEWLPFIMLLSHW